MAQSEQAVAGEGQVAAPACGGGWERRRAPVPGAQPRSMRGASAVHTRCLLGLACAGFLAFAWLPAVPIVVAGDRDYVSRPSVHRQVLTNFLDTLRAPLRYTTLTRELHVRCSWSGHEELRAQLESAVSRGATLSSNELWAAVTRLSHGDGTIAVAQESRTLCEVVQVPAGEWFVQRGDREGAPYLVAGRTPLHWFHYTSDWEQLDLFWREFGVSSCLVDALMEPLPMLDRDIAEMRTTVHPAHLDGAVPLSITFLEPAGGTEPARTVARLVARPVTAELALPLLCAIGDVERAGSPLMYAVWSYGDHPFDGEVPFPRDSCNIVFDASGIQIIWNSVRDVGSAAGADARSLIAATARVYSYARGLQFGGVWLGSGFDRIPADVQELLGIIPEPASAAPRDANGSVFNSPASGQRSPGSLTILRIAGVAACVWLFLMLRSQRSRDRGSHRGSPPERESHPEGRESCAEES